MIDSRRRPSWPRRTQEKKFWSGYFFSFWVVKPLLARELYRYAYPRISKFENFLVRNAHHLRAYHPIVFRKICHKVGGSICRITGWYTLSFVGENFGRVCEMWDDGNWLQIPKIPKKRFQQTRPCGRLNNSVSRFRQYCSGLSTKPLHKVLYQTIFLAITKILEQK